MARIRTIKPEFPQSESMGRVSRESRLCFILLWTLADDAGRLRGNSRMLASLLYPYDDDAKKHIDTWLEQLHAEGCIHRYEACGDRYIQVNNWSKHQKIDKPSASKIPAFDESSRGLANPLESSFVPAGKEAADQGREGIKEGTKDQPPKRSAAPRCPFEVIVKLYHDALPELPRVRLMGDSRKELIAEFWRWVFETPKVDGTPRAESAEQAIEWIGAYFAQARLNDFVMGRTERSPEHKNWSAGIDYLLSDKGKTQVIEKTGVTA